MPATLYRISNGLNRVIQALVCAMGMTMVAVVGAQVFFRYGLNQSLFWSEELARILLVWLTFFGATVAYFYKAHPGVDTVFRRLPRSLRKSCALASHGVSFLFFGVMIYYGIQFAWFVRLQITPALGWPKWVFMAAVPLSGLIFMVHALALLVRDLAGEREKK